MLKLRKILLCNYLYIIFIVFVLLLSLIRLSFPKNSNYTKKDTNFIGVVTKITYKENKLILYIKNKETVIASTYQKEKIPNIKLGDEIIITGTFKTPQKNTTEYLFNYKKYLKRKNIFYLIEINSLKKIKNNKNIYYFLKQNLINYLDNNPYLFTFILGDKSFLKDEVKRSYQENGISHLFAISGMHITLLASLFEKILKKFKARENTIFKLTSIFLFTYLILVGLSPSILRGVLFYFIFSLNRIFYFYIKEINLYLIILGISLLINPNYIFDIGFQYSYIISFSLILLSNKLISNNYFISLLKVSYLSFIISIPITIYNFYQINLLSIIYNLFFVPLISIIIFPLSLLSVIIKPLLPILNLLTAFLETTSIFLSKISFGKIIFKRLPEYIYFIYFLIIIVYLLKKNNKYLIFLIILLSIHFLLPCFDNTTYLKMLDVNQGDSILLHSCNKNVLIDTGGTTSYTNQNNDGKIFYNTISPTLKSLGIKKLDYLILTHGDKDHLGEAKTLIDNIKVKKIILNSNSLNYYEKSLINNNTFLAKQGLTFNVNDLKFIELNEDLDDENDSSQIYLVKYKNIQILLTGDASIKSEEVLLNNYDLKNIDILKVGHHGSKTSTSENLLETIKPKIALISSGKDNKFKHPHQEVINRLKRHNIKIYNTKDNGTVTINLDRLTIKTVT